MDRIGLGLITYKAPEKLKQSAPSVPSGLHDFVIVNDGTPYAQEVYPPQARVITHQANQGVAAAKNTAIKALMDSGCDHLFLMEDDVIIQREDVFDAYIQASRVSGIGHLNYALQGALNYRVWKLRPMDAVRYHLAFHLNRLRRQDGAMGTQGAYPSPRLVVRYTPSGSQAGVNAPAARLAFYPACVGAMSYYRREVIEQVGLMDERFKNAGDHVDHTWRIIQAGWHPPFGWFADIHRSDRYLANIPDSMALSTIRSDPAYEDWKQRADKLWREIHGQAVGEMSGASQQQLMSYLRQQACMADEQDEIAVHAVNAWGGLVY